MGTRVKTTSKIIFIIILTFNTSKHLKQLALPKNTISFGRTHEFLIKDFVNPIFAGFSSSTSFFGNNQKIKGDYSINGEASWNILIKGQNEINPKSIFRLLQNDNSFYNDGLLGEVMIE